MFRLSPLRVRVFRGCKLRYKYQYGDKLPARLRPHDTAGKRARRARRAPFAIRRPCLTRPIVESP